MNEIARGKSGNNYINSIYLLVSMKTMHPSLGNNTIEKKNKVPMCGHKYKQIQKYITYQLYRKEILVGKLGSVRRSCWFA